MPSRRSRSRSRSPSRERERRRSRSPGRSSRIPDGVDEILESDYFLKNAEFRVWLKEEKGKYFDELSGEKARSYFRKFVKAWNRGRLSRNLYNGVGQSLQTSTAYKWTFASKSDRRDRDAIASIRDEVSSANYGTSSSQSTATPTSGRRQGPNLPSHSDLLLARESAQEYEQAERDYNRKKSRKEAKEQVEDMVGPKEVGREGMLEKKRARREADKTFREGREDAGLEVDEGTLLGGGDSFRERIAQRDAARRRFEERRGGPREERASAAREKHEALKEKDKATMDMFMKMAQERFG